MKKAIEIATQEIDLHEKLKDTEISADYRRGFINGMYHLRNLFRCGLSEADNKLCGSAGCPNNPGTLGTDDLCDCAKPVRDVNQIPGTVISAIEAFLKFGNETKDKCHNGYYADGGWPHNILKRFLAEVGSE